jgi:hypothetical protein
MSEVRQEPAATQPEVRNEWESLSDALTGMRPEHVPALTAARELELVYPLLHALTRGRLPEFYIRIAALESLLADGRSPLKPKEATELLYWLKEPESVLRTLRESGWIEHEPGAGYKITDSGRFVATVLSFLRARVREQALMPSIEGVDYMIRCGVDPVRQLILLRSHLEDLRSSMEFARNSHSSVLLREAATRLDQALALSQRIRAVLATVPLELMQARRVAHDIHDLLSRLHGVGSELHSAITEVGRQYLNLVVGLSTTDIITALMGIPLSELATASSDAFFPIAAPPPLLLADLLGAESEAYLARQIEDHQMLDWIDPPEPKDMEGASAIPEEVMGLLDDLDRLVEARADTSLHEFVPRNSASESLLRATLLPLLEQQTGGTGVAGRLASFGLSLSIDGDGDPVPARPPLSALTPGRIEYSSDDSAHG